MTTQKWWQQFHCGLQTVPVSSHGNKCLQIWGITGLMLDTPPSTKDLSQWKELDCAYQNNYAYR